MENHSRPMENHSRGDVSTFSGSSGFRCSRRVGFSPTTLKPRPRRAKAHPTIHRDPHLSPEEPLFRECVANKETLPTTILGFQLRKAMHEGSYDYCTTSNSICTTTRRAWVVVQFARNIRRVKEKLAGYHYSSRHFPLRYYARKLLEGYLTSMLKRSIKEVE